MGGREAAEVGGKVSLAGAGGRGQAAGVGKAAAGFRSPRPAAGGCGGVMARGNAQRVSGFAWRGVL